MLWFWRWHSGSLWELNVGWSCVGGCVEKGILRQLRAQWERILMGKGVSCVCHSVIYSLLTPSLLDCKFLESQVTVLVTIWLPSTLETTPGSLEVLNKRVLKWSKGNEDTPGEVWAVLWGRAKIWRWDNRVPGRGKDMKECHGIIRKRPLEKEKAFLRV